MVNSQTCDLGVTLAPHSYNCERNIGYTSTITNMVLV